MSDSDIDLEQRRADPSALALFVLRVRNTEYMAVARDAIEAAQVIIREFRLQCGVADFSVQYGMPITGLARRIDNRLDMGGLIYFKRPDR